MYNVNVPRNGKVRVHPGPENFANAALSPTPFGVGFAYGADPQVVDIQTVPGAPGDGLFIGKASSAIGSSSTFHITGPGQFGTVTFVGTATIVDPLPPPPDPAAIDHFNPTSDPPELQ